MSLRNTFPPIVRRSIAIPPVQSHIYRHVMIVGEAAWRLSQALKDRNPQLPWKQIEGMRHIMVHDYFRVDWSVVYTTAKTEIPALKPEIEAMLRSVPPSVTGGP